MSGAGDLWAQLSGRFSTLDLAGSDATLLVRQFANGVGIDRWTADAGSFAVGEGLGTLITAFSPYGRPAIDGLLIDNVWVVLAVKGGLVAILAFAALIGAVFWSFIRAAAKSASATHRQIWLTLACSFPIFLASTTTLSSHLYSVAPVVLTVSTLAVLASLERPPALRPPSIAKG
jgi:hypothetical protein